jgi:hypothetical protein
VLINLTPHMIRIYPPSCPDNISVTDIAPLVCIHPTTPSARIGEISLGTVTHVPTGTGPTIAPSGETAEGLTIPVEYVEYTSHGGLVNPLPEPQEGVWLIVSLVVAIQQTYTGYNRSDLLVPYREVRTMSGAVVGCRQLARPV